MSQGAPEMTGAEFKARVTCYLTTAASLVPECVPDDVFDERVEPMMAELQELDDLLYGLGREERLMEDQERSRERRLEAKRAVPSIERVVERLDERIQKVLEMVGGDRTQAKFIAPMYVDMVIASFLRLLDHVPAEAFAEDRIVPPTFPSREDQTVAAVIAVVRDRRSHTADVVP